ncbi:phosphotransferase, partial [Chroococcidiopsis sp.]|uniref:phosphotransferase n=1 Tax=Chroococcidiopsis sp. TaxID=3088168 RepID=UPI003F357B7B
MSDIYSGIGTLAGRGISAGLRTGSSGLVKGSRYLLKKPDRLGLLAGGLLTGYAAYELQRRARLWLDPPKMADTGVIAPYSYHYMNVAEFNVFKGLGKVNKSLYIAPVAATAVAGAAAGRSIAPNEQDTAGTLLGAGLGAVGGFAGTRGLILRRRDNLIKKYGMPGASTLLKEDHKVVLMSPDKSKVQVIYNLPNTKTSKNYEVMDKAAKAGIGPSIIEKHGRKGSDGYITSNAGESLTSMINSGKLSPEQAEQYGREAAQKLNKFYKDTGYVHNDIHTGNILVDATGKSSVIDWELASKHKNTSKHQSKQSRRSGVVKHSDDIRSSRKKDRKATDSFMTAYDNELYRL